MQGEDLVKVPRTHMAPLHHAIGESRVFSVSRRFTQCSRFGHDLNTLREEAKDPLEPSHAGVERPQQPRIL